MHGLCSADRYRHGFTVEKTDLDISPRGSLGRREERGSDCRVSAGYMPVQWYLAIAEGTEGTSPRSTAAAVACDSALAA